VAVLVPDREQDPFAELVVDAAARRLARRGQPDLKEFLGANIALGGERPGHLVPPTRRPAELVGLDRLVGEAATMEVVEGGLSCVGSREHGVVKSDGAVEDLAETGLVGILAFRPLVDLDARALGERSERLGEENAIALHDEAEDVPAQAAAEAMPAVTSGRDDE